MIKEVIFLFISGPSGPGSCYIFQWTCGPVINNRSPPVGQTVALQLDFHLWVVDKFAGMQISPVAQALGKDVLVWPKNSCIFTELTPNSTLTHKSFQLHLISQITQDIKSRTWQSHSEEQKYNAQPDAHLFHYFLALKLCSSAENCWRQQSEAQLSSREMIIHSNLGQFEPEVHVCSLVKLQRAATLKDVWTCLRRWPWWAWPN